MKFLVGFLIGCALAQGFLAVLGAQQSGAAWSAFLLSIAASIECIRSPW
jgi:hypothetical protein